MNKKQVLEQLKDLKYNQGTFITDDKETSEFFEKDVEALDYAIKELESLNKTRLEELALEFIGKNYGLQEQEEPSYNIKMMIDYMVENYNKDNTDNYVYVRHCDECGKEMWEGYCIDNGMKYYCCAECLDKNYTEEEWEDLYATGDSYYTDWFEEKEEYNKLKEEE